jgi:hypothetical protein
MGRVRKGKHAIIDDNLDRKRACRLLEADGKP